MTPSQWESTQKQIIEALKKWFPNERIEKIAAMKVDPLSRDDDDEEEEESNYKLWLKVGERKLNIEWKSSSTSAAIGEAIYFLKPDKKYGVPIVAVPFMGPTGQERCRKENVYWMDLSGNAYIQAPGLLIDKSGNPNKFIKRGRPSSVFAPKSSRVIRWLLLNPEKGFTNRRIVHETGADEGHISRILRHLTEEGYISRKEKGEQRLLNPESLLADWRASYDFFKQCEVIRGHVPTITNEGLAQMLSLILSSRIDSTDISKAPSSSVLSRLLKVTEILEAKSAGDRIPGFAFTGLTAAWQYTQFVTHRLVTVYLRDQPSKDLLQSLRFREEPRGANVWLAIPKDEGVFMGTEVVNGICCVSRVQTYLDLKDQPERADEAAEELKRTLGLEKTNG